MWLLSQTVIVQPPCNKQVLICTLRRVPKLKLIPDDNGVYLGFKISVGQNNRIHAVPVFKGGVNRRSLGSKAKCVEANVVLRAGTFVGGERGNQVKG
jgi:hypothetical protein